MAGKSYPQERVRHVIWKKRKKKAELNDMYGVIIESE